MKRSLVKTVNEEPSERRATDELFTSTSLDSNELCATSKRSLGVDDAVSMENPSSRSESPRDSSLHLLPLPPAEVRRQALKRTLEKRRNSLNRSNAARRDDCAQADLLDTRPSVLCDSLDCRSRAENNQSKSDNSSGDRSLETDFDIQSEASSREPNDQFTSIESSGNEHFPSDLNTRHRHQPQPAVGPYEDDTRDEPLVKACLFELAYLL